METERKLCIEKNSVPLKEYFCDKLVSLNEKMELNFRLNKIALDKAESKMDERLMRLNEFRETLKDQTSTYISREEFSSKLELLESSRRDNWSLWISLAALIAGIYNIIK